MAAARFIRLFSRRQIKNQATTLNDENITHMKLFSNGKNQQSISIKNGLVCTVVFLDGDDINFEVDVSYFHVNCHVYSVGLLYLYVK